MRKTDNLPPYCAVVKNSRSLNFLDSSGPAWPVTAVLKKDTKSSYLTCRKEGFYNISAVRPRLNVVKFDHTMLSFF